MVDDEGRPVLKKGTGGSFKQRLRPGDMLDNLASALPDNSTIAGLRPNPLHVAVGIHPLGCVLG